MADQDPQRDDFYVGYLPLPGLHRRALRIIIPSLLWVMVAIAALAALAQRDPGPAIWENATPITREGVLRAEPYPMLEPAPSADGTTPSPIFLVEVGKRGAQGRAREADGRRVRLQGWRLERDGREMLELVPEDDAITVLDPAPVPAAAFTPAGPITLRGEIVDSKCYLGAMKPGDGKAHKACATLCIAGGIPPMLVTWDGSGAVRSYLVTDQHGGPIAPELLELIGEPVEVTGEVYRRAGLDTLRVPPDGVGRR